MLETYIQMTYLDRILRRANLRLLKLSNGQYELTRQRAGEGGRAQSGLEGWVECFPKAKLCGSVFGGGVTGAGEIAGSPALEKARALGRSL